MTVFHRYLKPPDSLHATDKLWLRGRDSNPRHRAYEARDLTTGPPRNIWPSFSVSFKSSI